MRSGAKRGGVPCQARQRMNGPRNYQRIITDNFIMPPGKLIGRFIQRARHHTGIQLRRNRFIQRARHHTGIQLRRKSIYGCRTSLETSRVSIKKSMSFRSFEEAVEPRSATHAVLSVPRYSVVNAVSSCASRAPRRPARHAQRARRTMESLVLGRRDDNLLRRRVRCCGVRPSRRAESCRHQLPSL